MQLGHAQKQLLLRCTRRWYSAGAAPTSNASDPIAASGTPVSPRLKRPLADSFGGINIQNVVVPSQKTRNGTNRFLRSGGSDNKSPDKRRTNQAERYQGRGNAGASSLSGWGDGLVTLSFSSRLKHHQKERSTRGTRPPPEAQPWKQQSKQTQRPQMQGHRRGQKEQSDATLHKSRSQSPRAQPARKSAVADGASTAPKASLMTRPSSSTFKLHAQPTTTTAPMAPSARKAKVGVSNAKKANRASSPTAVTAQQTSTSTTAPSSAGRSAHLTALSGTNLNTLFRTRDALGTGVPLPLAAHTSTTARVRSVLERSAGDYSRFLPRSVGVRKSASSLPALRTARHALAVQRDLSLEQRRVALHIIEGLTRPHQSQVRT